MQIRGRRMMPNPEVFNVNDIEDIRDKEGEIEAEIGALVQQQRYAPRMPVAPPTTEDLHVVTAEAVMLPYEEFAKNIEADKEPLRELAMALQKAQEDIAASIVNMDETAKRYRAMGEAKRELIQKSAAIVAECNELNTAYRAKIDQLMG